MAGQNTFQILLLNDANMIREHQETRIKMLYGCPFEKIHLDLNFAGSHRLIYNGKNLVTRDLGDSELFVGFREQHI